MKKERFLSLGAVIRIRLAIVHRIHINRQQGGDKNYVIIEGARWNVIE